MQSAQVKAMFTMMKDFAPALIEAGAILEAVEQSEATISRNEQKRLAGESELALLDERRESLQQEIAGLADTFSSKQREQNEKLDLLTDTMNHMKASIAKDQDDLASMGRDHVIAMAQYAEEIRMQQSILDDRKRALEQFMQSLPATN